MKFVFSLIISVCLFMACNSKKGTTTGDDEIIEDVYTEDDEYQFENVSPNDSLFASIERSPCFGQCPVYTMHIYNNGLVKYKGKNFVKRTGEFVMELTPAQMLTFVNKAEAIEYMKMDDSYDNPSVTDVSSTTSSIVINRTRKKIYRRFGFPKELIEYEQLFDNLLDSDKWIKVESEVDQKF